MWSTFITKKPSSMSERAVSSETKLPSRNCALSTRCNGKLARAESSARSLSSASLTCEKQKPPTTITRAGCIPAANESAWNSSGLPPTAISALGTSRVSVPRRLPSPAASRTTFMRLLDRRGQRCRRRIEEVEHLGEAVDDRQARKAEQEALFRKCS